MPFVPKCNPATRKPSERGAAAESAASSAATMTNAVVGATVPRSLCCPAGAGGPTPCKNSVDPLVTDLLALLDTDACGVEQLVSKLNARLRAPYQRALNTVGNAWAQQATSPNTDPTVFCVPDGPNQVWNEPQFDCASAKFSCTRGATGPRGQIFYRTETPISVKCCSRLYFDLKPSLPGVPPNDTASVELECFVAQHYRYYVYRTPIPAADAATGGACFACTPATVAVRSPPPFTPPTLPVAFNRLRPCQNLVGSSDDGHTFCRFGPFGNTLCFDAEPGFSYAVVASIDAAQVARLPPCVNTTVAFTLSPCVYSDRLALVAFVPGPPPPDVAPSQFWVASESAPGLLPVLDDDEDDANGGGGGGGGANALTIVAVQNPTALGGTASIDLPAQQQIVYTPPVAAMPAPPIADVFDTFTYTVQDALGQQATTTVTVGIIERMALERLRSNWKLDQQQGMPPEYDDAGVATNNGTPSADVVQLPATEAKIGTGAIRVGVDELPANVSDTMVTAGSYPTDTDPVSFSLWFRQPADGVTADAEQVLFTYGQAPPDLQASGTGWVIKAIGARAISFGPRGQTISGQVEVDIVPDEWHHVVATWNGLRRAVYFDGTKVLETALSPFDIAAASYVSIGSDAGATSNDITSPFVGDIDDVAVFDVELTQVQIDAVYVGGAGRPATDLVVPTV